MESTCVGAYLHVAINHGPLTHVRGRAPCIHHSVCSLPHCVLLRDRPGFDVLVRPATVCLCQEPCPCVRAALHHKVASNPLPTRLTATPVVVLVVRDEMVSPFLAALASSSGDAPSLAVLIRSCWAATTGQQYKNQSGFSNAIIKLDGPSCVLLEASGHRQQVAVRRRHPHVAQGAGADVR